MEVGAVKQAFNNEVIQLKRNLNQAKIQTIHKLTRKAKTFAEKKAPEKLKEKLKRKAESAVKEVLIMKKVKPKDIAKFAVTHSGDLQDYLNKPIVDQDKACARLLLHKSLQEKYKYIRNTFSNISINDLLMSRQERRKMKKEQQEKQKMKKDKKQKVVNAEGEWEVENVKSSQKNALPSEDELSAEDEGIESNEEANSVDEKVHSDNEELNDEEGSQSDEEQIEDSDEGEDKMETDQGTDNDEDLHEQSDDDTKVGKFVRPSPVKGDPKPTPKIANQQINNVNTSPSFSQLGKGKTKPEIKKQSKPKDVNKNKNLNEKLLLRKFKKDTIESEVQETKIVDPFFITSTGENYMSVAEPRQPDEFKEIHKQGNRKLRRAAMFGHVPKIKPRSDNSYRQNGPQGGFRNESNWSGDGNYKNNFNRNDSQSKGRNDNQFKGRNDNQFKGRNDNNFKGRNDNQFRDKSESKYKDRNNDTAEPKVEKLHPSWEAKKKKSGILPFQGKKIVFDESL